MAKSHHVRRIKTIHGVVVSVFAYGTEDESRVCAALRLIAPDNVRIDRQPVTGHFGNAIVILRARTRQAQAIREVFDALRNKLSKSDLTWLREQILLHLSETCTLVIKLDKQAAASGVLTLGKKDPIVVRAKIAAYPARLETAAEIARDLLSNAQIR